MFFATEARRARESSACLAFRSEGGTSEETSCCSISAISPFLESEQWPLANGMRFVEGVETEMRQERELTLDITRSSNVECLIDKRQGNIGEGIDDIAQNKDISNGPSRVSPHVVHSHGLRCRLSTRNPIPVPVPGSISISMVMTIGPDFSVSTTVIVICEVSGGEDGVHP